MSTYLSRLMQHPGFNRLAVLMPTDLCPFLYYPVSPYVFTLAGGGWFSWVKRTADPTDRKQPLIKKPAAKKINRLFINEVLVRCPNPGRPVIAGIGPWQNGAIAVRILHSDGNCPFHHLPGQRIIQNAAAATQSLGYSRLFPEVLLEAVADMTMKTAVALFNEDRAGSVSPADIINPCRYHDRPAVYDIRHFLPDSCCPHAFQQVYPHILAVMSGGAVDRQISIQHPGDGTAITMNLEKTLHERSRLTKRLLDGLYLVYGRLFHPLERLDYALTLTVTEGNPSAGCAMSPGQRFAVNLNSPDFLCPAGFHAVYPYLMLAAAGTQMDWGGKLSENRIPCPDCAGIVYGIDTADSSLDLTMTS